MKKDAIFLKKHIEIGWGKVGRFLVEWWYVITVVIGLFAAVIFMTRGE